MIKVKQKTVYQTSKCSQHWCTNQTPTQNLTRCHDVRGLHGTLSSRAVEQYFDVFAFQLAAGFKT